MLTILEIELVKNRTNLMEFNVYNVINRVSDLIFVNATKIKFETYEIQFEW